MKVSNSAWLERQGCLNVHT